SFNFFLCGTLRNTRMLEVCRTNSCKFFSIAFEMKRKDPFCGIFGPSHKGVYRKLGEFWILDAVFAGYQDPRGNSNRFRADIEIKMAIALLLQLFININSRMKIERFV